MDIEGAVPVKVNSRFGITITNFSRKKATGTKVHRGGFGNFGTSQAPDSDNTASFKVSIPKTGFEFDWAAEFAKDGASLTIAFTSGAIGLIGVKLAEDSLDIDEREGNTVQSVNVTYEKEIKL